MSGMPFEYLFLDLLLSVKWPNRVGVLSRSVWAWRMFFVAKYFFQYD